MESIGGVFSYDISEFIIDLICGFPLSEVLYSSPVTRSGGCAGACQRCFLPHLPFLRKPEERSSMKEENRVCIWISAHCGAGMHLRTPNPKSWKMLLDPTALI